MSQRSLFLAAYDVSDPGRLRRALIVLKGYATGGQKSVFECWLTPGETKALLAEIAAELDMVEDRFFLIRLDPRSKTQALGIAVKPVDPSWFYVG